MSDICESVNCTALCESLHDTPPRSCVILTFIVDSCLAGILVVLGLILNISAFLSLQHAKIGEVTVFILKALSLADATALLSYFVFCCWSPIFALIGRYDLIREPMMVLSTYGYCLTVLFRTICTWITVLICYHRYLAVCNPLHAHRLITLSRAKIELICVLSFSVCVNIPQFFEYMLIQIFCADSKQYFFQLPRHMWHHHLYRSIYKIGMMVVLNKLVPMSILCILSAFTISALQTRKRKVVPIINTRRKSRWTGFAGRSLNITYTLMTVIAVYIGTNLPTMIPHIVNLIDQDPRQCDEFWHQYIVVANMIAISNSTVNVLAYHPKVGQLRKTRIKIQCVIRRNSKYIPQCTTSSHNMSSQPTEQRHIATLS